MSENEWHGTRTWQLEPSTFLKRETNGSLLSKYYKLYSVANADDSTRFDIVNPLPQTLTEYFLSLLQIEFRYAFPCRKRWFLRPPVSQHHLAAIDFRFDDSQRFGCMGQPSKSRDSFCHKNSVWSRLTFYALAVLSSLTFFRVRGNTECIQKAQYCHISNKFAIDVALQRKSYFIFFLWFHQSHD